MFARAALEQSRAGAARKRASKRPCAVPSAVEILFVTHFILPVPCARVVYVCLCCCFFVCVLYCVVWVCVACVCVVLRVIFRIIIVSDCKKQVRRSSNKQKLP